jgi:S-adenosylmethionine-diacylgycerolhomoserine-N-methlytransferase
MSLASELKVLYHMMLAPIRGRSHAERLENFYHGQATTYDAFRTRLLHGRRALWTALPLPEAGVWVDMGGGTASNLLYFGAAIHRLARVYVVDMCPALLHIARQRVATHGWTNVTIVEADAARFMPDEASVDVVTFSYSLTMMPNWFAALDHAWQLLRSGGLIGVVDFYVSRKYPEAAHVRHPWFTRTVWPIWFGFDNVFPNPDHLPYLQHRFTPWLFSEHRGTMPYMPWARVPYYRFIGQKSFTPLVCPPPRDRF